MLRSLLLCLLLTDFLLSSTGFSATRPSAFFPDVKIPSIANGNYGEDGCLTISNIIEKDAPVLKMTISLPSGSNASFFLREELDGITLSSNITWAEVHRFNYWDSEKEDQKTIQFIQDSFSKSIVTNPGQPTDRLIWEGMADITIVIDTELNIPIAANGKIEHLTLGIDATYKCLP